jgi:DNA-binding transcriptional regulator YiaG
VSRLARLAKTRRHHADRDLDRFIKMGKVKGMSVKGQNVEAISPIGTRASDASDRRGAESEEYRTARDEYRAIRELRKKNWLAAHIRERRYELELTQQEVAERAGTSHSFVSKLESGDHIPTIPVLQRILRVLDEELLIGIERQVPDEEPEREIAPAPELAVS